jgi:ABC-type transporter Mla MlaB component
MSLKLPVELTKHNATQCLAQMSKHYIKGQQITIPLSSIHKIDSAGIALLLELKSRYSVVLVDPSPAIARLADLYQINLVD